MKVAAQIAVVGMACRVPEGTDADGFWRLLCAEQQPFVRAPEERMIQSEKWTGQRPWAALLEDVDGFDAPFFGITPRMATWMDPQQRLLLESSWHALESAALVPGSLAGTETGVYVASTATDYRDRMMAAGAVDKYSTVGLLQTFLANRISHQYDLRGPSITLDTACAGGLTAVGLAVSALRAGEIDLGLACAVNTYFHCYMHAVMSRFGALSPTGTAASFDARADGYIRGEGVFCVVLKRLEEALRDGDPVLAVVRGVAVTHDGRAGGLVRPDRDSLARLINRGCDQAGISPATMGYYEAHAAGTQVGDPVEVNGLVHALRTWPGEPTNSAGGPGGHLWVGSTKANIGHLEGAAGAASLAKALLVLRHQQIPATPGIATLNPELQVADTPVRVATQLVDWHQTADQPRRVGVGSLGVGGSNAFALLEEPPSLAAPSPVDHPQLVPISATNRAALIQVAAALRAILEAPKPPDLAAVAWTLQTGRTHLAKRRILLATSHTDLIEQLAAIERGEEPGADRTPMPELGAWLAGGSMAWRRFWPDGLQPRRITLPGYPFQHRPYWFGKRPLNGAASR